MTKDDHMRSLMLAFTLFLPAAASAQQVYKCVQGREVSYQSAPCAQGQATARTWEAQPDPVDSRRASLPEPVPASRQATNAQRQVRAAERRRSGTMGASIPVENSGNSRACQAAKASRARTLERVGLKRTFELLSKLDNAVHSACR